MIETLPFTPLIIIGAGRSGTNILRDTICKLDGFDTWDCDEINPIWRHGNIRAENDEFDADMANPKVIKFIRHRFIKQWKLSGQPDFLVEKTCANSLRVPFIVKILPEAKFLFIVRNGFDVVASAEKRWRGEMEIESSNYYWSKIKHTPLQDLPIYGIRFLQARFGMFLKNRKHLAFWGPQFAALKNVSGDVSLNTLCAMQWAACVSKAADDFQDISDDRVHNIKYEEFTASPVDEMARIYEFLQRDVHRQALRSACSSVKQSSVGKGNNLQSAQNEQLVSIMADALSSLGYITRDRRSDSDGL